MYYSALENLQFTYSPPENFISSHIHIHLMLCFHSSFCSFTLWSSKLVKVVFLAKITRTRIYIFTNTSQSSTHSFIAIRANTLLFPCSIGGNSQHSNKYTSFLLVKCIFISFLIFTPEETFCCLPTGHWGNILQFIDSPQGKHIAIHLLAIR